MCIRDRLNAVNGDSDLPNFKCSIFHVLLKEIGFEFGKRRNKAYFIDRGDIIVWLHDNECKCNDYLHKMKNFRVQGRNIIHFYVTWINVGHSPTRMEV